MTWKENLSALCLGAGLDSERHQRTREHFTIRVILGILLAATTGAHLVQAHGRDHGFLHQRAATTAASGSALPSPDNPTLTGTASNCNQWYDVVSGDSCWSISQSFGITQDQFKAWNAATGDDCVVEKGLSYCVGVGTAVSTSTGSSSGPASSSKVTSSPNGTSSISNATITGNSTSATPYSTLSYNKTSNPVTITDSTWPPPRLRAASLKHVSAPIAIAKMVTPADLAVGNNWYQAKLSDTCKSIVLKYSTWMNKGDLKHRVQIYNMDGQRRLVSIPPDSEDTYKSKAH